MSCSKCGSFNKCGCTVPYYQQTDVCVEDHCLKVYQPQFNFSVCPTSSWNVPQCGQTAILSVPGLLGATVGSYLWHPQFGYYKIISVDAVNGLLGVVNTCVEGNASAGAQVPACTCFVVTDPPVETNLSGVCVALDFVAPAEDIPLDILLTGTTGLTVGDIVQIGTGFYFLSAIKPDNIVTIINKGEGIIPGTPVVAFDAEGNTILCLSTISENPCNRETVDEITLLGCDGDGLSLPLNVDNPDWVVTGIDPTDNTVALRPTGAGEDDCTTLVGDFNLVAAVANYANVAVTSSSGFVVGDILEIQGAGSFRFEVTNIPNATHIDLTVSPVPAAPETLADESVVCIQSCCDTLEVEVEDVRCTPKALRFSITPQLFGAGLIMGPPQAVEGNITTNLAGVIQAPLTGCVGTTFQLKAFINISVLCDHDAGVIMQEVGAYFNSNPVAGRVSHTDFGSDGFDITTTYPPSTDPLFPGIWSILQINTGNYPMMYHAGEIVCDTLVVDGGSDTITLAYKALIGENNNPAVINSFALYVTGFVEVIKVG